MKFRNLLFATVALAGLFSACSNEMDNVIDNNDNSNVTTAEAYASFSFSTPAGAGTRATTTTPGTSVENNITKVHFLLYNEDGTLKQNDQRVRADFAPVTTGGMEVYTLLKEKNIKIATAATYKVHIVINPATTLNQSDIATISALEAYTEKVALAQAIYCKDNQFMMTNANNAVAATITAAHNANNPLAITIPVERISAKFTFTNTANNEHNFAEGKIVFDAYKVINTRNSAYKLKRVGLSQTDFTIGANEEAGKYVIENFFDSKTAGFTNEIYTANYSRRMDTYVPFRVLTNGNAAQSIAYSLENTIKEKESPEKGYTTGVILRGKATISNIKGEKPEGFDGSFYKFNGEYYYTLSAIDATSPNADLLGYEIYKTAEETKADYLTRISNDKSHLFNNLAIELYIKGYCYYYYWIRHNDDMIKDVAGPMEYAIVRNNVYQLAINSVSGLGSFESGTPGPANPEKPTVGQPDVNVDGNDNEIYNPEIPGTIAPDQEPTTPVIPAKPGDPIFDKDLYLNVKITVNPWTIRNNNIDL